MTEKNLSKLIDQLERFVDLVDGEIISIIPCVTNEAAWFVRLSEFSDPPAFQRPVVAWGLMLGGDPPVVPLVRDESGLVPAGDLLGFVMLTKWDEQPPLDRVEFVRSVLKAKAPR